ncbi:helix-turn-helix transcriptional regulator [Sphingomonas sp. HDW15A]|uniref:ArsR/SmtB family transcription factor n=1 Tax=Sphingomonas sp. HDW15A TaxID=2714942 RepID=UPI00140D3725|nr:metalloregulator ArsR/SmtB family transcription factor [Sphingomonas sp. HDW15A]QIK96483.1 helix-turn-helix transcriptional regulator [Sphingomonas sp. HDW15A]
MSPEFVGQAAQAATVMKAMAHEGRLRVLCYLSEAGELSAGELTHRVGLSQSALSQHLSLLRAEGLVATRKEAQSVHYRIADPKIRALLSALHDIYCPDFVVGQPAESHCER